MPQSKRRYERQVYRSEREMIINIVRKPLVGSVCENITLHNIGGININNTRIGTVGGRTNKGGWQNSFVGGVVEYEQGKGVENDHTPKGRFPSNVILSESAVEPISIQGGESASVVRNPTGNSIYSTENTSVVWNSNNVKDTTVRGYSDSGSVVRYFKVVKEK